MKKARPILLWMLCACFGVACTQPSTDSPYETPDVRLTYDSSSVVTLTPQTLHQSANLARPGKMVVLDSVLVVLDDYGDPPLHLIDRRTGAYLKAAGSRGDGPGEFQGVWDVDVAPDSQHVYVFDLALHRLTRLSVPRALRNQAAFDSSTISLTGPSPHDVLLPPGDSTFWATAMLSEAGRWGVYDDEGAYRAARGPSLPRIQDAPEPVLQHAYQSTAALHPSKSKLALAAFYADRIDIFKSSGTHLVHTHGPGFFPPIFEIGMRGGNPARRTTEKTRYGYMDVVATSSHIYALYSGRTRSKAGNLGNRVHVLDWEGRLQAVYDLKGGYRSIAISPGADVLYASRLSPHVEISAFRLPSP